VRDAESDKDKYTDKEKRQEKHIETATRSAASRRRAKRRAWATVNKVHGGGEKPGGGGYGKPETTPDAARAAEKGGSR
jgi:hypothetical protein